MTICASRITDLSISIWVSKSNNALAFARPSACPSRSSSSAFSARNVCNCSARFGPGLANWRWSVQDVVDELEDKVFRTLRTFLGGIARKDSPTSGDNLIYTPTECLDRFFLKTISKEASLICQAYSRSSSLLVSRTSDGLTRIPRVLSSCLSD
jgi:hypothetical protein